MRARRGFPVVMALLLSSCFSGAGPVPTGVGFVAAGGLRPFSSCDEFLAYVKKHALEQVTPWGLPGQGIYGPFGVAAEEAGADAALAPAGVPARTGGADYSETNVQTAGVDEPDIVKTDGQRLLALARGKLFVVDLSGDDPVVDGSLRLADFYARDLLLLGDRALLLGETSLGEGPHPLLPEGGPVGVGGPIAALVEVDLSDPAEPRVARRLLLDGAYVSARMTDGVARVVVRAFPSGLPFVQPTRGGLRAEREALSKNRDVIRESTIDEWVPYFVLEDGDGATATEGPLLDCASANHPLEFSGFGMLTVVTVDLSRGLDGAVRDRSVGVLSDGETVYASAGSLYVATQQWKDWEALAEGPERPEEGHVTRIHRFETSGPGRAEYRASGEVPGWLLNQFSMDEHEGHLRVASTDAPPFLEGTEESESTVTVLTEREGSLVEVGRASGLGKGERIFAVRFLGDLGYVVTFRQVDPLYVLDLSDPTRPSVEGELKILGYSAYLHPLEDGRLLGVGQDATRAGRVKGTQLSTFDVSDPAAPRRIDAVRVSDASSEAEWDHHAFLYWAPEGLAVVPVNVYRFDEETGEQGFFGALAVRVRDGTLEPPKRLTQQDRSRGDWALQIRRSLVVGDRLFTVSDAGLEAADLSTLEDVAWVPFA